MRIGVIFEPSLVQIMMFICTLFETVMYMIKLHVYVSYTYNITFSLIQICYTYVTRYTLQSSYITQHSKVFLAMHHFNNCARLTYVCELHVYQHIYYSHHNLLTIPMLMLPVFLSSLVVILVSWSLIMKAPLCYPYIFVVYLYKLHKQSKIMHCEHF